MKLIVIGERKFPAFGQKLTNVSSTKEATKLLCSESFDAIVIDVMWDIVEFMSRIKEEKIIVPVLSYGFNMDFEPIENAIKAGAKDYLLLPSKPFVVSNVLESLVRTGLNEDYVVYKSSIMHDLISNIKLIEEKHTAILGERGSGKYSLARIIAKRFARKHIELCDCQAAELSVIESQFFGHVEGFAGAKNSFVGKIKRADRGVLVIKNFETLPLNLKERVTNFLTSGVFTPNGTETEKQSDVLCVFAQQDRIGLPVFIDQELHIPSLRSRREDVECIVDHYMKSYAKLNVLEFSKIPDNLLKDLQSYDWPGNVSECISFIKNMIVSVGGDFKQEVCFSSKNSYTDVTHILGVSIRLMKDKLDAYRGYKRC